ncbi:MAG TPA: ATP-binding protein [Bacteriovoracaceae bacterium]|nr:ATP-binding protein [Bacteriovoracaceae bacterium]
MLKITRYLSQPIIDDLQTKMVFVGGPRQVGKTTLALSLFKATKKDVPFYLNWDRLEDRSRLIKEQIPLDEKNLIFDEIHKYKFWRRLMKGLYDKHGDTHQFIVTGSARLDHFRKGGDSLLGRYHYYRLHPLTLNEITNSPARSDVDALLKFGGFPEPYFNGSEKHWRRWQKERIARVVHEDLRDLQHVKEISLIDILLDTLPSKVGSPLSIASLREDLGVAHQTVDGWVGILDSLYMTYRILPYGPPKVRAVKKEQKLYFWDWSMNTDPGARFENMLASHLLKYCHYLEDTEGYKMELRYLRDTDKREIDFVVLKDKKPLFAAEAKLSDKELSSHVKYFQQRTNIPKFYQVHLGEKDYGDARTGRVLPFHKFCKEESLF